VAITRERKEGKREGPRVQGSEGPRDEKIGFQGPRVRGSERKKKRRVRGFKGSRGVQKNHGRKVPSEWKLEQILE
jgi:hypothetical protein